MDPDFNYEKPSRVEKHDRKFDDIKTMAKELGIEKICSTIFNDKKFSIWSGASKSHQHHYGVGGLLDHTWEIIITSYKMALFYDQYEINKKVLFLAALFHDYGKTYDYEVVGENLTNNEPIWGKSQHARRIHHISRSVLLFQESYSLYMEYFQEEWGDGDHEDAKKALQLTQDEFDNVVHCILAHHGRREWGSPVSPNTREAWILHLCDAMSARMFDCDTFDRID
jgi:3'-5' exoribonuclease